MSPRAKVLFLTVFFLLTAFSLGVIFGVSADFSHSLATYDQKIEKLQQDNKIASFQKDLDYLTREDCKDIHIVAINKDNEVKDCKFLHFDCGVDSKVITVMIDEHEKSYAIEPFMSKVVKIECGDDFSW